LENYAKQSSLWQKVAFFDDFKNCFSITISGNKIDILLKICDDKKISKVAKSGKFLI
jgi:hypothetical protein|tara:strand:- start:5975 stop:6145 length:171 start_codon:yes stop_codon:yes gene_type:complete